MDIDCFYLAGSVYFDDLNFEKSFASTKAYAQSKLCITLFTRELARRLEGNALSFEVTSLNIIRENLGRKGNIQNAPISEANIEGITVYSVNPGVVDTDIARHWDTTFFRSLKCIFHKLTQPFLKTAELGAQTVLHCALDENAAKETGLLYKSVLFIVFCFFFIYDFF